MVEAAAAAAATALATVTEAGSDAGEAIPDGGASTERGDDPGRRATPTPSLADEPSNAAPSDISLAGDRVAENAAAGTVVGTLAATDPDAGERFTYSLVSRFCEPSRRGRAGSYPLSRGCCR